MFLSETERKRDLLGGFAILNMYKHYSRRVYDTSTPKLTTIIDSKHSVA